MVLPFIQVLLSQVLGPATTLIIATYLTATKGAEFFGNYVFVLLSLTAASTLFFGPLANSIARHVSLTMKPLQIFQFTMGRFLAIALLGVAWVPASQIDARLTASAFLFVVIELVTLTYVAQFNASLLRGQNTIIIAAKSLCKVFVVLTQNLESPDELISYLLKISVAFIVPYIYLDIRRCWGLMVYGWAEFPSLLHAAAYFAAFAPFALLPIVIDKYLIELYFGSEILGRYAYFYQISFSTWSVVVLAVVQFVLPEVYKSKIEVRKVLKLPLIRFYFFSAAIGYLACLIGVLTYIGELSLKNFIFNVILGVSAILVGMAQLLALEILRLRNYSALFKVHLINSLVFTSSLYFGFLLLSWEAVYFSMFFYGLFYYFQLNGKINRG